MNHAYQHVIEPAIAIGKGYERRPLEERKTFNKSFVQVNKLIRDRRPDTNNTENLDDECNTSINVKIPNVGVGNAHSEGKALATMPGSSTSDNNGNNDLRDLDTAHFMKINDDQDAFNEEPIGARVTLGFDDEAQSPTRFSEKRKSTQPDEQ